MKEYGQALIVLDNLIRAAKLEGDFVGYKSLKTLKEDAEKSNSEAIAKVLYLYYTLSREAV